MSEGGRRFEIISRLTFDGDTLLTFDLDIFRSLGAICGHQVGYCGESRVALRERENFRSLRVTFEVTVFNIPTLIHPKDSMSVGSQGSTPQIF